MYSDFIFSLIKDKRAWKRRDLILKFASVNIKFNKNKNFDLISQLET